MARFDDKEMSVARIYARALLSLAKEARHDQQVRDELDSLGALYDADPAFRDFLTNPAVDAGDRERSLEKMFRARLLPVTVDTLQVINRKGRSALLPAVVEAYRQEHDKMLMRVEVQVTSARPLTDPQREKLGAAVRERTGREPSFVERVEPSLLGGIVVQIGDEKTDGSVVTRLRNLGGALLDRASHEIHSGKYVEGTAT